MIEAKMPLAGVYPWFYCQQSAKQKVPMQGNAEYNRGGAPEKVRSELRKRKRALQDNSQRLNLCAWDAWARVLKHQKR